LSLAGNVCHPVNFIGAIGPNWDFATSVPADLIPWNDPQFW
jgi:hypothetical protein